MDIKEKILQSIFIAIDEINDQDDQDVKLDKSLETILLGQGGGLDSLGIVNLIVAVEENINETFDLDLTLADERALSQESSPFSSVKSLLDYVFLLLDEKNCEE
jgi:acyl carrier protein